MVSVKSQGNSVSLTCKHPRFALKFPMKKKDGSVGSCLKFPDTEEFYRIYDWNKSEIDLEQVDFLKNKYGDRFVQYPCGKCIACRLRHSYDWANRLMLEKEHSTCSYFLTLTYDDEHLSPLDTTIMDDGSMLYEHFYNLKKKDIQDFMKRLRMHWKRYYNVDNIRFYACGEYGSQTQRPHYHLIIFNAPFFDLEHRNFLKPNYFLSPTLLKLWDKGFHTIVETNWSTCAYVSGYVVKKYRDNNDIDYDNFEPEFSLMSRRPGIAREYYDKNVREIYERDELIVQAGNGKVRVCKPVKYYDRLFDIDYPDMFENIKEYRRLVAEELNTQKQELTGLSYSEILSAEERALKNRWNNKIKIL